mgnify:CR=1 FL=1
MKTLTIALALMAATTTALAAPELLWEAEDLGDDWWGYTFSVSDDNYASWAVNIDFQPAHQIKAFGSLNVNWQSEANTYDVIDPNYDKDFDSWVFDEWNALTTGISGLPGEPFHIHAGTPGGMQFGTFPLVYIAVQGDVGWSGVIARLGADYYVDSWGPYGYEMYPHGPYEIAVGEPLVLDATGSWGYGYDIDLYEWDLDGDGVWETSSVGEPILTLQYDYLQSLGLGPGGPYTIALRGTVTVSEFETSGPEYTTLTIVPEPAAGVILISGFTILIRCRRNARLRRGA